MNFVKRMRLPAAAVLAVAQERASALRSSTFAEVSALPSVLSEVTAIDGCDLKITVYRDPLPDGRVRVVVQSYLDRLFGIGTMTADGFIIAPDNSFSELPEKMLYEFC